MLFRDRKKNILTVPNLLSLLRIVLIPVYARVYFHATSPRDYRIAGALIALSCLTDLADGIIARKLHMITALGKVLDPIADKATQFALILCLWEKHPILGSLLPLLIVKESFQLFAGALSLRRGRILTGAIPAGKAATAVLFSSLTALVLFPDISQVLVRQIVLMNAVLLIFSMAGYILVYAGKLQGLQKLDPEGK